MPCRWVLAAVSVGFMNLGCTSQGSTAPPVGVRPPAVPRHRVAPEPKPVLGKAAAGPTVEEKSLPPLWPPPKLDDAALPPPVRFALPALEGVADLAHEAGGRAWLLGESGAALYRLEGSSVAVENPMVCGEPRPPDLAPEEPWPLPSMQLRGVGLFVEDRTLSIVVSRPGPGGSFWSVARRDARGELRCDRPPFFTMGAVGRIVHSGDSLWTLDYTGLQRLFPDRSWNPPKLAAMVHDPGVFVPFRRGDAAPLWWDTTKEMVFHFNGVRWESWSPPDLRGLLLDSLVVDDAGTLWGVTEGGGGNRAAVVAFDGETWRGSAVPGLDEPDSVIPIRQDSVWIVGKAFVAYYDGARFHRAAHGLVSVGRVSVDPKGRLWLGGEDQGQPAPSNACTVVLQYAPPQEPS